MAGTAPMDFVKVGATVVVVDIDAHGPRRIRRAPVAKINAHYFTVEGIDTPGGEPRPVQFRNRLGMGARSFGTDCHQTAQGDTYVMADLAEIVAPLRARIAVRRAGNRIGTAEEAWRKINHRRTSRITSGERPSADEIDTALVEIIESAVAMRAALAEQAEKPGTGDWRE